MLATRSILKTVAQNPSVLRNAIATPAFGVRHFNATRNTQAQCADSESELLRQQRKLRPVSPDLTIYQPQITAVLSGLHRITGAALGGVFYLSALAYLAAPAFGATIDTAGIIASAAAAPVALKVIAKATIATPFVFHSLNGVRHLVWDAGKCLNIKSVYTTGYAVLAGTAVGTAYLTFIESSIDHLLGSTPEEPLTIDDTALQDFSQDSLYIAYSDQDHNTSSYKTVRRENHVDFNVPGSKSKGFGDCMFSCKASCVQFISYGIVSTIDYKSFDLEKLDVVLGSHSVLPIEIECTLNGLNVLEYPTWISDPLDLVMSKVNFTRIPSSMTQNVFKYQIKKAFVTTPISYLLQVQAPYGTLDKLYIHIDWSTTASKQFQLNWSINRKELSRYVEQLFESILMRKTFHVFPLIFSDAFVKRVVPIASYLPRIAHSLQKIIKTSKDTSHNDFNDKLFESLDMIKNNTHIMKPVFTPKDDLVTNLTLGMYHTVSKTTNTPNRISLLSNRNKSSPNALNAVTKIWSIMVPDNES
ncbi:hypothetical protein MFLAVUS_008100 [Mucor flavus]|uniref:Uncharacterized protein n=1 Tax=Mucor flavus TaxID=439312 RepID=A0ABP9Z649_9FUNG